MYFLAANRPSSSSQASSARIGVIYRDSPYWIAGIPPASISFFSASRPMPMWTMSWLKSSVSRLTSSGIAILLAPFLIFGRGLYAALPLCRLVPAAVASGADAYITKPFSISLLLARISKLIEQRDKLREKFSNEPGMVHAAICTNNKDSKFLAKLNEMLNEHMVETEFSVDDYANLMGLGRTVFYKKVRGVTGYSPNEYLRVIRLKKAAELLLTEDLTVSEISYKVGINDPYYFSKCFKNQFGIAPSVYQKNGGKAPASNDTAENTEQTSEEKEEGNKTDV